MRKKSQKKEWMESKKEKVYELDCFVFCELDWEIQNNLIKKSLKNKKKWRRAESFFFLQEEIFSGGGRGNRGKRDRKKKTQI